MQKIYAREPAVLSVSMPSETSVLYSQTFISYSASLSNYPRKFVDSICFIMKNKNQSTVNKL